MDEEGVFFSSFLFETPHIKGEPYGARKARWTDIALEIGNYPFVWAVVRESVWKRELPRVEDVPGAEKG
jgi:hypothetical protein